MPKIGLFTEYKNEEKKGFDHVMCYETKVNSSHVAKYSHRKSFFFQSEGFYVFLGTSIYEVGRILKEYNIPEDKALHYFYSYDPHILRDLKRSLPKLTLISGLDNPRIVLEITKEGFKWENYDNISLPKQDKNTEGDKPAT